MTGQGKASFMRVKINKINRSEDGFTFIELMITLLITSLLIIGVSKGLIGGSRIVEKAVASSSTTVTILQMDNQIRSMVSRVYFPFWYGNIDIEENSGTIEIPFYEGGKNNLLHFSFENNYLDIGLKKINEDSPEKNRPEENRQSGYNLEKIQSYGAFSRVDLNPAVNKIDEVFGLQVTVYPLNKKYSPVNVIARFGSTPIFIRE